MESIAVMRVVLVRHAQTEWNDGARFQGHLDSPLTAMGIRQAEGLAKRLASESISAVYSSDLGRAVATAEIIGRSLNLPVLTDARLRERALGIFQGLSKAEITERYPEESRRYYSREADYAVPGGESARGRFALGFSCLNDLVVRHAGQTVVGVTHGGIVQGMFRHVTGVAFEAPRRFAIRNAAYNVFAHAEHGWSLETWGDVAHLPLEMRGPVAAPVEQISEPLTP
jgi:probable phosphoglycerate mutase